jgi:molecular chaperone IbpA
MTQLVRFDTNSLNRALLGFDTLFDDFQNRYATQANSSYPPYNILKHDEDSYELEIAVTGFLTDEITVEIDQNQLVVKGQRTKPDDESIQYLHRGLSTRDFTRSWTLAEHMEVGEGTVKNGVLSITLYRRIPESLKPRQLQLKSE